MRQSKYLETPKISRPHVSINSKVLLSDKLVNFSEFSQENIESYIKSACRGERPNIPIIYATAMEEEEAHKIENLTKREIAIKTFDLIDELCIEKRKLYEERFNKNIKKNKKEDYVLFYYEVQEILSNEIDEEIHEVEIWTFSNRKLILLNRLCLLYTSPSPRDS